MKTFHMNSFVKKLSSIYHRQIENETKAAKVIKKTLADYKVPFEVSAFWTRVPRFSKAQVNLDGQSIPAIPTCFVSGEITSNYNLVSSLTDAVTFAYESNINFNPKCKAISRSDHHFRPSVAIHREDVLKVCKAKKISIKVKVTPTRHKSENILVGNRKNPENIIFCHYDSLGPGACDNASGTAVLLESVIKYPETLEKNLYVIGGNEELSYDEKPAYWGFGYRDFEKKHLLLMQRAKKILVVDSVGNGKTEATKKTEIVFLGFPIKNLEQWQKKTYLIYGDFDGLMQIYHSDADTPDKVKQKYLLDALRKLHSLM